MTNGDPAYWVRAEQQHALTVLDLADKGGHPSAQIALAAARDLISERGVPDDSTAILAAVGAEREAILAIVDASMKLEDPLGNAMGEISKRVVL